VKVLRIALLPLTIVAVGCSGGGSGKAGGKAQERMTVLTLATHENRDVGEYARAVERLSRGSIRIELETPWRDKQVDYDRGTFADVRAGRVELAKIGVRSVGTLGLRTFQALEAPLLVESLALERKVLAGTLARRMLAGVRRLRVEGVALVPGDLRRPFGISRQLLTPNDFRGATIGIRPSLVSRWTFEALRATPRAYAPGALPPTFDGAELDPNTIQGNNYDTAGTSLTANVALWPRAFVIVANATVFARLTREQRAILREAGREALAPAIDRLEAEDADVAGVLCRRRRMAFVDASPEQRAALRIAIRPVFRRLAADRLTRAAIDEILHVKRAVPPEKPRQCRGATPTASRRASSLDGVYVADTTAADLQKVGAPARDVIPENCGHWLYVLADGRIAFTQEDAQACTWAYGKVAIRRGSMAWTIVDGGASISPNNAYNRPGEFFRFGWSRYRETLTLTPMKGAISPENFRAKPWHRVSKTPSTRYFSKRCPPPKQALQ
jgi:TRAP-type C4-dicarboxylate transport system substrate-binding protein